MSMIYSFLGKKKQNVFQVNEFRHDVLIERGDKK